MIDLILEAGKRFLEGKSSADAGGIFRRPLSEIVGAPVWALKLESMQLTGSFKNSRRDVRYLEIERACGHLLGWEITEKPSPTLRGDRRFACRGRSINRNSRP